MFNFGTKVENIENHEIKSYMSKGAILLDIRNKEAYESGHIDGATHIPIRSLLFNLNKLDKSKTILVICYVGGSSVTACKLLQKSGFKVKNILGGMQAWNGAVVTA